MPLSQISWPFIAQAVCALLVAIHLKRKETAKLAEPTNGKRVCDLHESVVCRFNKGDEKFDALTGDMSEVKKNVAVIIERLEHIKEQVSDNKTVVMGQYNQILERLK